MLVSLNDTKVAVPVDLQYSALAENGQSLPVQIGTPIDVNRSARIIKEHLGAAYATTYFGELTGTNSNTQMLDVSNYEEVSIDIKNNTDVDMKVTSISFNPYATKDIKDFRHVVTTTITIPAAGKTRITKTQVPELTLPNLFMYVLLQPSATAPTTGTFDVVFIGAKR